MSRFIRSFVVTLVTLPGLLLVGSTAAFARTDRPAADTGALPAPPVPGPDSVSFADRLQWMAAGAGILLALIVVCVAASSLVYRRRRPAQPRIA
jgi:hypothetical protein